VRECVLEFLRFREWGLRVLCKMWVMENEKHVLHQMVKIKVSYDTEKCG